MVISFFYCYAVDCINGVVVIIDDECCCCLERHRIYFNAKSVECCRANSIVLP